VCSLVFQERSTLPNAEEERTRYTLHRNNEDDDGYLRWLQSFIDLAVTPWYQGGTVLDFGSGPNPVLTGMLRSQGINTYNYDPFFAPEWPLRNDFSLILMCEVLEHIHDPILAFDRLFEGSADKAVLSVKTQFLPSLDKKTFEKWWYKEDPTHIRFYTPRSLQFLGEATGWFLVKHDLSSLAVFMKHKG